MDTTSSSDVEHPTIKTIVVDDLQVTSNDAPAEGVEPEAITPPGPAEIDEEMVGHEPQPCTIHTVVQAATAPRETQQPMAPTDESLPQDHPPATPAKSSSLTPSSDSSALSPSSSSTAEAHLAEKTRHDDGRPQTPSSVSTPSSANHRRSLTMSRGHTVSVVLISSALETILASKEAKRSAPLRDSAQKALEMIRVGQGGDRPREIFEPLRLACETRSEKLMIASLDCISKLISYSFFAEEASDPSLASPPSSPALHARHSMSASQTDIPQPSLVDLVVYTITSCHSETTPEPVSLQVVKALLALILSPTIYVHHSSLLKAVRTVYNVFLLSTDPVNQMVAQGGLTQMVHHIFTRCRPSQSNNSEDTSSLRPSVSSDRLPSPSNNIATRLESHHSSVTLDRSESVPPPEHLQSQVGQGQDAIVLPSSDRGVSHSQEGGIDPNPTNGLVPSVETPEIDGSGALPSVSTIASPENGHTQRALTAQDMFTKDAFLVFRALCKLTMKPLNNESEHDLKSHAMRSKLLSLHLVLTVLNSHMPLIVDSTAIIYSTSSHEATTFVQAINQYLCLCLSRNAVSPVPQVFEVSVEIFWRVLVGMRTRLKKEIEVLLHEIFIPILEMRTSTLKQKAVILAMLSKLFQDPQALVELYLNYDCDSEAVDNIYEHLMTIISKIATIPYATLQNKGNDPASPAITPQSKAQGSISHASGAIPVSGTVDTSTIGLSEGQLRRQGLESLASVLRSLVAWGTTSSKTPVDTNTETARAQAGDETSNEAMSSDPSLDRIAAPSGNSEALRQPTPDIADDPTRFESAKQKKTTLLEGIKKFNFKPKRGVQFLVGAGFIPSSSSSDIARFLLTTDGLSKVMVGEYLGEGDEANVAVMHAFVDFLDFRNLGFLDALRLFLQAFRLPGEAQKIDRFMLKFAERYIGGNPHTPFKNADTAYVLAYSTILLNTDAHNPQIKHRMTKADFIRNNRGINDGEDLPEELLSGIFDEIQNNEIRMKDEVDSVTLPAARAGLANVLANVGRDLQKEAYMLQSSGMANKTEALFRTLMRSQRRSRTGEQFFSASHFIHVRPMFEVAWISFLAGLSGPLQNTDDMETVDLCLDGFKNAIRIACFFDLELERNAFVTTLAKFTFLNNLGEMKSKNMEAIKTLLDVAVNEGNNLKGSWRDVLSCVSQLEHMQLISSGIDVPDIKKGRSRKLPAEELANESRSTHITVAADMVFSLSHYLSGTAIVDFVRSLCDVSWEEIQSSGLSQHPRLFSLQKLVEISYYNMNRIRLEWSNLWDILGEHFNQVCCHSNPHVGFFALDSLRQLSMRFLEKEELPHFKFQKDFLKPFEHTMLHNANPDIRDMVLQCLQQMIQARVQNMRSGWRTMFGVFSAASKVLTERIASSAFEIVTKVNKDHFGAIVRHGAFADLTVCITEFCKVSKYQKLSLLAIAMLRGVIPIMLSSPGCGFGPESQSPSEDSMIRFWFPVLFGFYDIIMNGEDLEVRRLALDSLFTTLKSHGRSFSVEFWDTICRELLFPIFAVLKSSQDLSRFSTQEDMSVWLSTTMIQALRDLIDLYTFYYDMLERFLDGLLDLLCVCICQENDTLARIGTSCLQQFLENNVQKLTAPQWERVASAFVKLFRTTTPHELFDENLRVEIDGNTSEFTDSNDSQGQTILPAPISPTGERVSSEAKPSPNDRRRTFKQIIVKCVLQLLLIETTNDLLRNDAVYTTIPPDQLLRLMGILDHSYQFAHMFNDDKELRTGLWKVGFMKHLPNLLKQESSSAATLVHVLLRMYFDERPEHQSARPQIAERLLPLSLSVLSNYAKLRTDTQAKNITAWTPVVTEILDGFCRFDNKTFAKYLPVIYPLCTSLLARDIAPEVRLGLKGYFERVGYSQGIMEAHES
ncbi:hypothetical protein V8B97DRAFT_2031217 [Scleroderma yunnanense]